MVNADEGYQASILSAESIGAGETVGNKTGYVSFRGESSTRNFEKYALGESQDRIVTQSGILNTKQSVVTVNEHSITGPKSFKLITAEVPSTLVWFEENLGEHPDDVFTLGFDSMNDQFFIKNSKDLARYLDMDT